MGYDFWEPWSAYSSKKKSNRITVKKISLRYNRVRRWGQRTLHDIPLRIKLKTTNFICRNFTFSTNTHAVKNTSSTRCVQLFTFAESFRLSCTRKGPANKSGALFTAYAGQMSLLFRSCPFRPSLYLPDNWTLQTKLPRTGTLRPRRSFST